MILISHWVQVHQMGWVWARGWKSDAWG